MVSSQGLGASIMGAIPYSAIRLGSYDGLKWAYKQVWRPANTCCPFRYICSVGETHRTGACNS